MDNPPLLNLVLGIVLLGMGRRLFWLFIAAVGFLVAIEFSQAMLMERPPWFSLVIALGAGLLGALLAIFAQRVAFALAGFYASAYLAVLAARGFGVDAYPDLLVIAVGLAGALVAVLVMDWAIIALSSLVGAGLIVGSLDLSQGVGTLTFLALVTVGAIVQARLMSASRESST